MKLEMFIFIAVTEAGAAMMCACVWWGGQRSEVSCRLVHLLY